MANLAYFQALDEFGFVAGDATTGPWSAGLQHGGPPSALLVRAAERAAAAQRDGLTAMRLSVEFVGPVPVGEVHVETQIVRAARSAVLVAATLSAAGRVCLQGRVWLVACSDTASIATPGQLAPPLPAIETGLGVQFPYHDTIEWRSLGASMAHAGAGATWALPRYTLVGDEPMSGLQRVVLVGDSASGISSELDWDEWSFVNVDLDVHLSRPFIGEWIHLDARTMLGTAGAALARSNVSDELGEIGTSAQTLVLTPRR